MLHTNNSVSLSEEKADTMVSGIMHHQLSDAVCHLPG
jgi:hypothetical protein